MNTEVVTVHPYYEGIQEAKHRFLEISGGSLNYSEEEIFAMQMLTRNDYVFGVANKSPYSVQLAMVNVAATGLTLNPAMGYAYLVPRDGQIMLDISYKGLIKIATDTGSIVWARAEPVYENDQFTYLGPAAMPQIKADPFRDRGEIIGAYCVAKTVDGDMLTEVMDRAAIEVIRDKSTAYTKGAAGKKGPWEDFFSEMCRKAVIKRARKTWPYTDRNGRLATAIDIANQAEGGYTLEGTGDPGPLVIEDTRKERHDDAADQYEDAINAVKQAIANEEWRRMTMHWNTIPRAAQMDLWLAPTKGGIFTTAERRAIKDLYVKMEQPQ